MLRMLFNITMITKYIIWNTYVFHNYEFRKTVSSIEPQVISYQEY